MSPGLEALARDYISKREDWRIARHAQAIAYAGNERDIAARRLADAFVAENAAELAKGTR